ncbi:hypothetical protein B4168_3001 [Anoxybacillus flavithermus]|nr:hypothetical protein B4168_3001 [Anoxybacillus flavithermus]OAO86290.1 hypothetical protein GT23_2183 [Parageobacillus thermoglucosidasius]
MATAYLTERPRLPANMLAGGGLFYILLPPSPHEIARLRFAEASCHL